MTEFRRFARFSGWVASGAMLLNNLALALGQPVDSVFFATNVGGSVLMVIHCIERKSWPLVILNGIFAVIGLIGIWRIHP